MEQLRAIWNETLAQITVIDIIDIIIVAFIAYWIIKLTRNTRAIHLLKGLGLMLIATQIFNWVGLQAAYWISNYMITAGAVLIVVIFQPELRRALEQIGRVSGKTGIKTHAHISDTSKNAAAGQLHAALQSLSRRKVGALIVIEQSTGLDDIIQTGTLIDAEISSALIENIFEPNTPLHDGAVIVRNCRVQAAACLLPLSDNPDIDPELGTRHRAAIGVSEVSDAVTIVVSEETGIISMTKNQVITRYLDYSTLKRLLEDVLQPETKTLRELLFGKKAKEE